MSNNSISGKEWEAYLDELYEWIQEKYLLFEQDKISQDEYNEHLDYYMKEKERIEQIITSAGIENVQTVSKKTQSEDTISQENFEKFFGVKLQEEFDKIDRETKEQLRKINDEIQDLASAPAEEQIEAVSERTAKETDVWEFMSFTEDDDFNVVDMTSSDVKAQEIKILLIGDSAVGRTSLRRAWMGKHFIESHLTTIGASIEKKVITLNDNTYEITLTDLGGQDFYSGLRRNFYRNIDGAILVFDLTRPDTFRRLDFWIKEMYREIKKLVPFILVGNKKDSKNRKIPEKYGIRASAQFSRTTLPKFRVRYMETSAKSGDNVNEIFETICQEVIELKN